jgi:hypothetical protein
MRRLTRPVIVAVALWSGASLAMGRSTQTTASTPVAVPELLNRIGESVEKYFGRARHILCTETVRLQPLGPDLVPDGHARVLVFDLRVTWEPAPDPAAAPEATILREIRTVNGRVPGPRDEPGCTDPRSVSPEPLAFLLSARRDRYAFSWAGFGRGREGGTALLDYRPANSDPPEFTWRGDCVSVSLPARTRGRVWADVATGIVVRLDEHLTAPFSFTIPPEHRHPTGPTWLEIERADSSIRYQPVTFHDPEETVMLPSAIDTMTVIQGAAEPRLRMTHRFTAYRRFLTDVRIVKE